MTTFKNQLKTILLLGTLSALVVGIGALVAPGYLYLFGALALAMNLGAYFFSDRVVLRMHQASEVDPAEAPELHAMVEELSTRAGIPKPRLFVIPEEQPNAFATGRNPRHGVVAVTEGLLGLLDRRELRGVIAQRLLPRANGDGRVAAFEIVVATAAVSNLIRDGKTHQIPATIQTGKKDGMMPLDASLKVLAQMGVVTVEEARRHAANPSTIEAGPNVPAGA